jgi:hypothetical protein
VWSSVLAAALFASAPIACAVGIGLTISPASITSDFVGKLTFSITNLTPGMTVIVESFADLNDDGIIDAGDLFTQSFRVSDGQVPLVAGVRNLNVPGDDDGLTNGQIRTALYFPPVSGSIPLGRTLVRVSDPSGILTSMTQSLVITPKLYPQGVVGRLTAQSTGKPLANTVVGLESAIGTTAPFSITDSNGNYSFSCVPGTYAVAGFNVSGAVYSFADIVQVSCGKTATNNLVVTNGTFFIAGRVTDSATGLGVPGMSLDVNNPNNLAALTLSDTNGNYAFQLPPGNWALHPSTGSVPEAGYVDSTRTNITITIASVSNVNFALSKPTALIHGTIKDALNNPVVGVQVSARDPLNSFHAVGRSLETNASYCLGVLANTWAPTPDSGDLAERGFTGHGSNVIVVASEATNVTFVVTRTNWPTLQSPLRLSNSQFQVLLNGLAGQNYTLLAATNLGADHWVVVLSTNLPCNSTSVVDSGATNSSRFYRARVGF